MIATLRVPALALATSLALAGCAGTPMFGGANQVTTSSVQQAKVKIDPVCQALNVRIDALRADGLERKIERAAARKYRFKKGELAKVDQLTKANAEFQGKCSTLPRTAAVAPTGGVPPAAALAGKKQVAAAGARTSNAAVAKAAKKVQ